MRNRCDQRPLLRLFVYGTLRCGGRNYRQFCARAISIFPATVWGRLYYLPAGFPALELAEQQVLAKGTACPRFDALCLIQQQNLMKRQKAQFHFDSPVGDCSLIQGELITFASPVRDLPPIDCLEGFRPNGSGLYQRVMVIVRSRYRLVTAWIYCMENLSDMEDVGSIQSSRGRRIITGRWHI